MIIRNAKFFADGCRFVEKDLMIRDGRIVFGAAPEPGEEILDAQGAYALPGLVDIHFHGAVGHDFCDADEAGLQAIADFEASKGVLAICPATMTFSEEILNGIMDVAAAHKNERGADLVGINMEGPYISPNKVGAQNPKYVMTADAGMFRRLQARSGGLIKLVDIAPEVEPEAIAEGIAWAADAAIDRKMLHDTVARKFSASVVARQYIQLSESLLKQHTNNL